MIKAKEEKARISLVKTARHIHRRQAATTRRAAGGARRGARALQDGGSISYGRDGLDVMPKGGGRRRHRES